MLHPSPTADALRSDAFWRELLADEDRTHRPRWRRMPAYRRLAASGELERTVEAYASGKYEPRPPVRHHLNKADGRKKVVFTFAPADELIFKALNDVLQPLSAAFLSPLCHSFRPGRGPRSAFRDLFKVGGLERLACLHVDVRDYFNSIPVEVLLAGLPLAMSEDMALMRLLSITLRDARVLSEGRIVVDIHKGVMAGTPLAPLLSNVYLSSLDRRFEDAGVTYLRYADDILVLAEPSAIGEWRATIEDHLGELGLELNPKKTRVSPPGASWEFLGFRYERGRLDVAPKTAAKLRRRVRRISRRARGCEDAAARCARRLNRRLYGVGGRPGDFSWAGWFFPVLSRVTTLERLDAVIQDQLRFAVTGVHSRRNLRTVPYPDLRQAGYLPLVTAYHAYRRGVGDFERLVKATCHPNRRSGMIVAEHAYPEHPGSAAAADSGLL